MAAAPPGRHSGGYESHWAKLLRTAGIEVRIVDPKRVRHFARSAGRLAKNDPIDAVMIAWFAETFPDAVGRPHDAKRKEDHRQQRPPPPELLVAPAGDVGLGRTTVE